MYKDAEEEEEEEEAVNRWIIFFKKLFWREDTRIFTWSRLEKRGGEDDIDLADLGLDLVGF